MFSLFLFVNISEFKKIPTTEVNSQLDNIEISEIPRVKVIAEKYVRFKLKNIELRKLEEKIVCIEYDIQRDDKEKPTQIMRAYFSLKSNCEKCKGKGNCFALV